MDKPTTWNVRLPESLKRSFLDAAARNDRDGAQLVRDFMRDYVARNAQGDLLKPAGKR